VMSTVAKLFHPRSERRDDALAIERRALADRGAEAMYHGENGLKDRSRKRWLSCSHPELNNEKDRIALLQARRIHFMECERNGLLWPKTSISDLVQYHISTPELTLCTCMAYVIEEFDDSSTSWLMAMRIEDDSCRWPRCGDPDAVTMFRGAV
jgi:hypothetical protein